MQAAEPRPTGTSRAVPAAAFELACPICTDTTFDLNRTWCVPQAELLSALPTWRCLRAILCAISESVRLLHSNLHVCRELMTMMLVCSTANASLHCPRCQRTFNTDRRSGFVDLTLSSGASSGVYKEPLWGGVQIFRYAISSSCSAGCKCCGVLFDI